MSTRDSRTPLLRVEGLKVHFPVTRGFVIRRTVGIVKAVDGISFEVYPGETLGLVGESGSGKTTTGRAVMMLSRPTAGRIQFEGRDLTALDPGGLRGMRRRMGIVFQDPQGSLNPRMTAGNIVGEPLIVHGLYKDRNDYRAQVAELLHTVGLNPGMASRYPHSNVVPELRELAPNHWAACIRAPDYGAY